MKSKPYSVWPSFSNFVGSMRPWTNTLEPLPRYLPAFSARPANDLRLDAEEVGLLLLLAGAVAPYAVHGQVENGADAVFAMANIGITSKITDKLELVMAHA